jgi:FMN phosphatase YigB (HAD superfamily)
MVECVIFDFGDTLVDYPLRDRDGQISYIVEFIEKMAAVKAVSLKGFESAVSFANRLNFEKPDNSTWPFVERVRSDSFFGSQFSLADAIRLERAICDGVFSSAKELPDARPALLDLRERGIRTGIVSNLPWGTSSAIWCEEFARRGFGSELIDQVVCCVDVGYRKPHPAAVMECVRRLNCNPSQSVYVGDRPSDILAGKLAGVRTILIHRRDDSHTDEADSVIYDLRDLGQVL